MARINPEHIEIGLGARSYGVRIIPGILAQCTDILAAHAPRGRIMLLTDTHVASAVLPDVQRSANAAGVRIELLTVDPGEASKSWATLGDIVEKLLALNVERGETLITLGGGIIGDLGGFAASMVKRGMKFIQIPTSLLAQVDSSVGGKTGINSPRGKNLIGAFYQPATVLIDPLVLNTLPDRHMRAGYAEIVKYGLINNPEFFGYCETHGHKILARDPDALAHAITVSVASKAAIVAADERETQDIRALLNLGHTFGHALEAETGFSDALYHGEAVAAGMALAFRFSAASGRCPVDHAARVTDHLAAVGLPTGLSGIVATGAQLVAHMAHDKKMTGGTLPFILATGIGQAYVDATVSLDDVAAFLDREAR